MEVFHDELHVFQAVFADNVDQLVHFVGVHQQVAEGILKGHEHVQLLEDAGAHDGHAQVIVPVDGGQVGLRGLPALGALAPEIGDLDVFLPFLDVLDDLVFRRDDGDGRGGVLGEGDVGPPGVDGFRAADAVAADELEAGIAADGPEGGVAAGKPVGTAVFPDGFQEILFRAEHERVLLCYFSIVL